MGLNILIIIHYELTVTWLSRKGPYILGKTDEIRTKIERLVQQEKLECFGIVRLGEDPDFPRFQEWMDRNLFAGMNFLKNHHQSPHKEVATGAQILSSGELTGSLIPFARFSIAKTRSVSRT